jgi:hypothetical protein
MGPDEDARPASASGKQQEQCSWGSRRWTGSMRGLGADRVLRYELFEIN